MQSIWDKMADVEQTKDGLVISNYMIEKRPGHDVPLRRLRFTGMKAFKKWQVDNREKYQRNLKKRLTPHQYYITQGEGGMERAFTGEYFWTNDVGRYDCVCCT